MAKEKVLVLGHMGRDEALADRLDDVEMHFAGLWANPGLLKKAEASGGAFYVVNSITDPTQLLQIAAEVKPSIFLTNFDDSLAAGVPDALKRQFPDLIMPCPLQEDARVEWDKFYLRKIVAEINDGYNPINFMVEKPEDVAEAIYFFKNQGVEIAIKPRNLTGGKGVKVMGEGKHFNTYEEGQQYALEVLAAGDQTGVEIQEKLEGHEFTLQIFTDGKTVIRPPATYDYPYREDGDTGPGTGGMGTFSMAPGKEESNGLLPFITQEDYDEAISLAEKILQKMRERGHEFKGVIYPTFFKTPNGLKIVEVNARGGDPELVNILDLMEDDVDFVNVLKQIDAGELTPDSIRYKKAASAMIYLVSPDYGYRQGPVCEFSINPEVMAANDVKIRFAAAERVRGNMFRTVGSSRSVGFSALGATPWEARSKIMHSIVNGVSHPLTLDFRRQVADQTYIKNLK